MIARLRRIRLLAVLLLGGTPGLGGVAVQAFHPCPAEMPWLTGTGGEHSHHSGSDPATADTEAGDCHCIGSCSSSAPASASAPAVVSRAELVAVAARHRQPPSAVVLLPIDRFPPKTAPPLLG